MIHKPSEQDFYEPQFLATTNKVRAQFQCSFKGFWRALTLILQSRSCDGMLRIGAILLAVALLSLGNLEQNPGYGGLLFALYPLLIYLACRKIPIFGNSDRWKNSESSGVEPLKDKKGLFFQGLLK